MAFDIFQITFTNTVNLNTQFGNTATLEVFKKLFSIELGAQLADNFKATQRQVVVSLSIIKTIRFACITPNHFFATVVAATATFFQFKNRNVFTADATLSTFFLQQLAGKFYVRRIADAGQECIKLCRLRLVCNFQNIHSTRVRKIFRIFFTPVIFGTFQCANVSVILNKHHTFLYRKPPVMNTSISSSVVVIISLTSRASTRITTLTKATNHNIIFALQFLFKNFERNQSAVTPA